MAQDMFGKFCSSLKIESKEEGLIPLRFYGGQRQIVTELQNAIREDKRRIWLLKCRQMGASTVSLAFDLYWLQKNPGLQGAFITNDDSNREYFKSVLTNYHKSLPSRMKIPIMIHNRNQLEFINRTRMVYLVAGERSSGNLGVGKGLNFLHGTECSRWGGDVDIDSLTSALSKKHPYRFFIFESTANGYNAFKTLYEDAKRSMLSKAIFITWWHSPEIYSCPKGSPEYKVYADTPPVGEEREWVRAVQLLYKHEITKEQLAWWRATLLEDHGGKLNNMYQEMPPCVTGETRVGTDRGLIPICEASIGMKSTNGIVVDTKQNIPAQIYKMTTDMGYTLRGTGDHPIFTSGNILVPLKETQHVVVKLSQPMFSKKIQKVEWWNGPIHHGVSIGEEVALLLGLFMGDGFFHVKGANKTLLSGTGVLEIVVCNEDQELIDILSQLIQKIFGINVNIHPRKGCTGVRASSPILYEFFRNLGLLRVNGSKTLRNVHVPEFIFRSPKKIIALFLAGLFEADGCVKKGSQNIIFCTKYYQFAKDIQLLLLMFGITCSLRHSKSDNTWLVNLRKQEGVLFSKEIGFLSLRKRLRMGSVKPAYKSERKMVLEDKVVMVEEDGYEPVYNLTVEGDHAFDANGILTHNTEELAFQFTGTHFFSARNLTAAMRVAEQQPYKSYTYSFGYTFEDTQLHECEERISNLKIWEQPKERGVYVLGADPAYASSDNADRFCVQVFRCYSDRLVQVAKFSTPDINTKQFAWVCFHLAGYYSSSTVPGNVTINLEVNGSGEAVLNEMDNMRSYNYFQGEQSTELQNVLGCITYYMYRRLDSFSGVTAFHWKTSPYSTKPRMMNFTKSGFEMSQIVVRSVETLNEMKDIEQNGSHIAAAGTAKDDEVMAMALCVVAWIEQIQPVLRQMNMKWKEDEPDEERRNMKDTFMGGLIQGVLSGRSGR